eukprot:5943781-Prymnesium_polylepis.1
MPRDGASGCSHVSRNVFTRGVVPPLSGAPSLLVGRARPDCCVRAPGRLMTSHGPLWPMAYDAPGGAVSVGRYRLLTHVVTFVTT